LHQCRDGVVGAKVQAAEDGLQPEIEPAPAVAEADIAGRVQETGDRY